MVIPFVCNFFFKGQMGIFRACRFIKEELDPKSLQLLFMLNTHNH